LHDELRGLLASHPEVRSRTNALESANKAVDEAFAGFLLSLDLSADTGPEGIDSPGARTAMTSPEGRNERRRTRYVTTVTGTQNLFDGFATSAELDQAQLNARVARFTLEGTRQNTMFDGIDAYLNVLRQKRLIELARSNERTIMRQLNLEDERVQRGAGIAVDVLESKRRLQLAKERRVNFEDALEDAVSQYIQVFDHAPDMDAMVDPVPPVELLPATQDQAVSIASTENPAVSSSRLTVEVAHQLRRAARADYYPTFDLVGSYNFEKHRDSVIGTRREWSVLLQATWNLFNGQRVRNQRLGRPGGAELPRQPGKPRIRHPQRRRGDAPGVAAAGDRPRTGRSPGERRQHRLRGVRSPQAAARGRQGDGDQRARRRERDHRRADPVHPGVLRS